MTQKEIELNMASRLEQALIMIHEDYKCPNPNDCREGDACPNCDRFHTYTFDIQKVMEELRGQGGYIPI